MIPILELRIDAQKRYRRATKILCLGVYFNTFRVCYKTGETKNIPLCSIISVIFSHTLNLLECLLSWFTYIQCCSHYYCLSQSNRGLKHHNYTFIHPGKCPTNHLDKAILLKYLLIVILVLLKILMLHDILAGMVLRDSRLGIQINLDGFVDACAGAINVTCQCYFPFNVVNKKVSMFTMLLNIKCIKHEVVCMLNKLGTRIIDFLRVLAYIHRLLQ